MIRAIAAMVTDAFLEGAYIARAVIVVYARLAWRWVWPHASERARRRE